MIVKKIISGGQTGVDRAALDVAIKLRIPHGGWCPEGRLAELGKIIPEKYLLTETSSSNYSERTKLNIRDSDGTLIIINGDINKTIDGTLLTIEEVKKSHKPFLIANMAKNPAVNNIVEWINNHNINVLNIAGPRESQAKGIYLRSVEFLEAVFVGWAEREA